jgi:hypothetical protein
MLSETILETLATTVKWAGASYGGYVRDMKDKHLGNVIAHLRGCNLTETYCGLSKGEWLQVMLHERNRREVEKEQALSNRIAELKEHIAEQQEKGSELFAALQALSKDLCAHICEGDALLRRVEELEEE